MLHVREQLGEEGKDLFARRLKSMPAGRAVDVDDLHTTLDRKLDMLQRLAHRQLLRGIAVNGYLAFACCDADPVDAPQLIRRHGAAFAGARARKVDADPRIDE